jgi:Tfp pilus assembly protein PilN
MREIDFLPDRVKAQRDRRRRLVVQGYLMIVCLAGLAGLGYMFHVRVAKAQTELDLLTSRGDAMKRQLALRGTMEEQLSDLMIKKRIEEQLGRRVGTLDVLGELQRVMPDSMTLTNLAMESVEIRMPAPAAGRPTGEAEKPVKRVRLVLTGMAPSDVDVANFIGQLAGSRVFEDVNMGYARNITYRNRAARQFQASCYVR